MEKTISVFVSLLIISILFLVSSFIFVFINHIRLDRYLRKNQPEIWRDLLYSMKSIKYIYKKSDADDNEISKLKIIIRRGHKYCLFFFCLMVIFLTIVTILILKT